MNAVDPVCIRGKPLTARRIAGAVSVRFFRLSDAILGRVADALKVWCSLPSLSLLRLLPDAVAPKHSPILDHICLPPFHGPWNHDDLQPLLQIIATLQPRLVVELGTAHGNLTANVCNEAGAATVYTVNAPAQLQTGRHVTYSLSAEEIGSVYRAYGFSSRVVQILVNTNHLNLSHYLSPNAVDLAIIDACHDTCFVLSDFNRVRSYVRPGGMVLFHDTHPSMVGHLRGSYLACMMLRVKGYDVRHLENTWWAIWRKPETAGIKLGYYIV